MPGCGQPHEDGLRDGDALSRDEIRTGRPWKTDEKDPGCLDAFRAEIPQCIQHYERESQKCNALVSDEESERREIEDELERLAIEEELAHARATRKSSKC